MKDTHGIYMLVIVCALTGCAAPVLPPFVPAPEPPAEWKVLQEKETGCPDATGEYEITPKIAILQNDNVWKISDGNWYDFILLIPFNRVTPHNWSLGENSPGYSPDSLLFESNPEGETLQVISPDKNNKNFVTHVFSKAEKDYKCQAGNLVFPEFQIQGGTEGSFLSGRIYRQATKTAAGDLLFYEQVQSHEAIHKFYLFEMKNS